MKKRKAKSGEELVTTVTDGVIHFTMKPKWKLPVTFHTSSRFMDYLHGDVDGNEAEVACHYEYTRESKRIWEVAIRRDELLAGGLSAENATLRAIEEIAMQSDTTFNFCEIQFLMCRSFPTKDWKGLSRQERESIVRFLPTTKLRPLSMPDVWTLKAMGILDKFKTMGDAGGLVAEAVSPGKKAKLMGFVLPILQQHQSFHHAIFTLDFSKSEAQLVNEFRAWLRLRENQTRLNEFKKTRMGTTGKPLDRLKDLAAWRLFREKGNDWDATNEFANKHRNHAKPFHNARTQDGQPANKADLFGEPADAHKAKARACAYLREIVPLDFPPPPSAFMDEVTRELEKLASRE